MLPVVEMVINSIVLTIAEGVVPPAMTHLVLDVAFCFALVAATKLPKSAAFPSDAIVIKSIVSKSVGV